MKDQDIDNMVNLAMEKQSFIKNFLKLTEEQAEAIGTDNFDSILNLINKKQNIIEQINMLDLNCQNNMPRDNEVLRIIDKQIRELMNTAIALDNKNIMALKNNQAQIFEKLKTAKQNTMIHSLYRGTNRSIKGILLDKKK